LAAEPPTIDETGRPVRMLQARQVSDGGFSFGMLLCMGMGLLLLAVAVVQVLR
jgi:hypothetical protein